MLKEYTALLATKRKSMYEKWDEVWAQGKHLTTEIQQLLEMCYYDDVLDKSANGYGETAAILMKLNMQAKPKLHCIYNLLCRDNLYEVLCAMEVNPCYFMLALFDYVVYVGNLAIVGTEHIQQCVDLIRDQNAYNAMHRNLKERLKVFYD